MRKLYHLLGTLVLVIMIACQSDLTNSNKAVAEILKMVPNDALSVTEIKIPQLLEKADFENFKHSDVYGEILKEAEEDNDLGALILSDPQNSGIDLEQSIFFISGIRDGKITKQYSYALMSISSPSKFETMLSEVGKFHSTAELNGIQAASRGTTTAHWTEQYAIIGYASSMALENIAQEALAGNLNENASTNRSLASTLSKNHDIISWTSSNSIAENKDARMMIATVGVDPDALKDNYMYSYADFENGVMSGRTEFDLQKKLTKDLDLFFKSKSEVDFTPYIPADNLSFSLSAAIDAKGINQVLSERPSIKMFLTMGLEQLGITTEELTEIVPGDFNVSFYNMGDGDENTYGVFVMATDDEKGMERLLELGVKDGSISKIEDGKYVLDRSLSDEFSRNLNRKMLGDQAQLILNDGILAISTNTQLLDKIASGGINRSKRLDKSIQAVLANHIFGLYVDFQELNMEDIDIPLPIENLMVSTSRKNSDVEMNFVNKNENSLKQILNYINKIYLHEKDNDNYRSGSSI